MSLDAEIERARRDVRAQPDAPEPLERLDRLLRLRGELGPRQERLIGLHGALARHAVAKFHKQLREQIEARLRSFLFPTPGRFNGVVFRAILENHLYHYPRVVDLHQRVHEELTAQASCADRGNDDES